MKKKPSRYPTVFGMTLGELALTVGKNHQYFYQKSKGAVFLLNFVKSLEAGMPKPENLGKSIHYRIDFLELARELMAAPRPAGRISLSQTEEVISVQILIEKNEWVVEFIDESVIVFFNANTLHAATPNQACEVLQNVWNAVFAIGNTRIY